MAVIDPSQNASVAGWRAIVLTGVVLGLGYNYLALQGAPPHRGLTWITEPKVFQDLEALTAQPAQPAQTSPIPCSGAAARNRASDRRGGTATREGSEDPRACSRTKQASKPEPAPATRPQRRQRARSRSSTPGGLSWCSSPRCMSSGRPRRR